MTQSPTQTCKLCGKAVQSCACYRGSTMSWADLPSPEELVAPGELVKKKYQVLRSLGRGATATVYLVRHLDSNQLYAMKMLNRDLPNLDELTKRFELEATAMSQLTHPNIVALYDFGMVPTGHPFFITDFVQGKSVLEVLKQEGTIKIPRFSHIIAQVCDAMDYAHKSGIIHRDLKSSNILLIINEDNQEVVRIIDFGIVKFINAEKPKHQKLTQDGTVLGSPLYMSPEQCQSQPLDQRTDIYSMGCLMYEMLSGSCPFTGKSPMDILIRQITEPAPSICQVHPELQIDPALDAIVLKALAKKPDDRFQSMHDLQQAILSLANSWKSV